MAVSREQVFEVLQRVHPALEQGLPGWSVRPNITGTGAVGLYLDGPELPLMGVNLAGEPVARHLCGTVQSADRGLPGELDQVRYQYILGVSVTERDEEYPELTDLPKTGSPAGLMLCGCWISRFSLNEGMNFSSAAVVMCPVVGLWGNAVWRCGASSSPANPGWVWARLTGARVCGPLRSTLVSWMRSSPPRCASPPPGMRRFGLPKIHLT